MNLSADGYAPPVRNAAREDAQSGAGFLVADAGPDSRHGEIDGYFQALGERFTERLDRAGIPLRSGHVMARWPMWRKRLSEWCEQLSLWTADRRVKRVQQANILLDFQSVTARRTWPRRWRTRWSG